MSKNTKETQEARARAYIIAADKAIRLTGNREARKGWDDRHSEALQATLLRLYRQLMDGTLPMPESEEAFIKKARTQFMGDLKAQWATKSPCCGYLAPGQHQKGPLSLRAAASLRSKLGLPADYPLTEAWLEDEVENARYCAGLSLDVGDDNDGRQDDVDEEADPLSFLPEPTELEQEAEGALKNVPPILGWIRVVIASLPSGGCAYRLAARFIASWETGEEGDKNLTASSEALGLTKRQLENAKDTLAEALKAAPQASGMVARVKKCGGRGAKLLK